MVKKEKIESIDLIEPIEWENTHIDSHKKINESIRSLSNMINSVENFSNHLSKEVEWIKEVISNKKDIEKLRDDIKTLRETLGDTVTKIKDFEEKYYRRRKYYTETFEWILDTESQIVIDLDPIELDEWTYLVNIVVHEAIPNWWTLTYSFGNTTLTSVSYTPHIYLQAKSWEKAVLEYDFSVIITEV